MTYGFSPHKHIWSCGGGPTTIVLHHITVPAHWTLPILVSFRLLLETTGSVSQPQQPNDRIEVTPTIPYGMEWGVAEAKVPAAH